MLGLNKPIYEKQLLMVILEESQSSDGSFSWEKTDKSGIFKK